MRILFTPRSFVNYQQRSDKSHDTVPLGLDVAKVVLAINLFLLSLSCGSNIYSIACVEDDAWRILFSCCRGPACPLGRSQSSSICEASGWGRGGGLKRGFSGSKWPKYRPYNLNEPVKSVLLILHYRAKKGPNFSVEMVVFSLHNLLKWYDVFNFCRWFFATIFCKLSSNAEYFFLAAELFWRRRQKNREKSWQYEGDPNFIRIQGGRWLKEAGWSLHYSGRLGYNNGFQIIKETVPWEMFRIFMLQYDKR
jgi:hypothetical protein